MRRRYRRVGLTAAQSAELWERWKKGEADVQRGLARPLFSDLKQMVNPTDSALSLREPTIPPAEPKREWAS